MGRKKNANKLPPFVPMVWEMLNSRAYKDLPPSAAKALPFFLGKIKAGFRDAQRYQIEFSFSYGEGEKLGFAPATFSKIIKALVSYGFLDPADKGGLRGLGRSFNFFKLSSRWEKYGNADFESVDWRCFLPRLTLRSTSKREIYNFKKGNKKPLKEDSVSHFEVVEEVLQ